MALWPARLQHNDPRLTAASRSCWQSLPAAWRAQANDVWLPLASEIAQRAQSHRHSHHQAAIIGIHGGQGSGKSTLSNALARLYQAAFGWQVAVISIDDLYLSKAERQRLARDIHPLLATRGVPGTHDVHAGITLFEQLRQLQPGQSLSYPAFDKIRDDRCPAAQWHSVRGPLDLILFEGWCVGCRPQPQSQLLTPVNALERTEDPDGRWRHWVNRQLAGDYQNWFSQINWLLTLQVPGMQAVQQWRSQQEQDNRRASHTPDAGLNEQQLQRFIQHYQRLTEHALQTMPDNANLVLQLNSDHQVADIHYTETVS